MKALIPNLLTLARLLLVPVFLYLVIKDRHMAGAAVFLVAALTDAVDGFIARRCGAETSFGANFDPFVDKTLLLTSYVLLSSMGIIPLWLGAIVVIRDLSVFICIMVFRGAAVFKDAGVDVALRTTVAGKATTVLQVLTVLWALAVGASGEPFAALGAITAMITVFTGADYVRRVFSERARRKAA